jgi:hypothetical protein
MAGPRCEGTIAFAALAFSHWIENQTGWSIKKFVPHSPLVVLRQQLVVGGSVSVTSVPALSAAPYKPIRCWKVVIPQGLLSRY